MSLTFLPYIQIFLSVVLVVLVLLQHSEASAGGAFGQSDTMGSGMHSRRGPEKVVFISTIVVAVLFALSAIAALVLKS